MVSPELRYTNEHTPLNGTVDFTEPVSRRDHVLSSFTRAANLMRYENPDTGELRTLTHEEELDIMLIQDTANGIRFHHGENTITRQWHDKKTGEQYTIEEGVPVDRLLTWLKSRMTVHGSQINEEELSHILEVKDLFDTLSDFSIPFLDCHDEMPAKTYKAMRVARIRLEEELIESCLPGLNPKTRRELAHKRMNGRMELRPPKDYSSRTRMREVATALFLNEGQDTSPKRSQIRERLSAVPKESVVFVTAATAINTILQDQGLDPETIVAVSTATVTAVSAATQYKRLKNNDGVNAVNKEQILKYSIATGGATLAAGTTSPEVVLYTLDSMPPQIEQAVKAGVPIGTAFAAGVFKNRVLSYLDELFEKSPENKQTEAQRFNTSYDTLKKSQLAIYDTISIMMNHYAGMSNLARRLGAKITRQWKMQGSEFEKTTKQLMLVSVAQKGTEAERAFVRYKALTDFIRYRELYIHTPSNRTVDAASKTPAFDALRDLDHLALSVFENLHELFDSESNELRDFSFNYERGLGLAYLLSLRRSWDDNDPRAVRFDSVVNETEDSVYGNSRVELEKKVNNSYKKMLKIARFKKLRKIKEALFTDYAEELVDVAKDATKNIFKLS